jgi:hypothetical protein
MSPIFFVNMSLQIENQKKEQQQQEEVEWQIQGGQGAPVCGANLSSPIIDQANYIEEIHYRIGNRMYVENTD